MEKYIPLDALIAEIEKRKNMFYDMSKGCEDVSSAKAGFYAQAQTLEGILSFINSLKVTGVDLEKEIKDYFDNQPIITKSKSVDYKLIPSGEEIAKHFFELGLKAQKDNIRHSMDEIPNYPCDILFVTNVDNVFLYRYMENGRPVDRETPYFHNILNGKCWYYCNDIVNIY